MIGMIGRSLDLNPGSVKASSDTAVSHLDNAALDAARASSDDQAACVREATDPVVDVGRHQKSVPELSPAAVRHRAVMVGPQGRRRGDRDVSVGVCDVVEQNELTQENWK